MRVDSSPRGIDGKQLKGWPLVESSQLRQTTENGAAWRDDAVTLRTRREERAPA